MTEIADRSAPIHWIQNVLHRAAERHGFHFSIIKADETTSTVYLTQIDEHQLDAITALLTDNAITLDDQRTVDEQPMTVILSVSTDRETAPMAYQPRFEQQFDHSNSD